MTQQARDDASILEQFNPFCTRYGVTTHSVYYSPQSYIDWFVEKRWTLNTRLTPGFLERNQKFEPKVFSFLLDDFHSIFVFDSFDDWFERFGLQKSPQNAIITTVSRFISKKNRIRSSNHSRDLHRFSWPFFYFTFNDFESFSKFLSDSIEFGDFFFLNLSTKHRISYGSNR